MKEIEEAVDEYDFNDALNNAGGSKSKDIKEDREYQRLLELIDDSRADYDEDEEEEEEEENKSEGYLENDNKELVQA